MDIKEEILFTFVDIDEKNEQVTVRPYSSKFKNPPEHYPEYNISLSTLDPNKDLNTQIGALLEPTIQSIINKEKNSYPGMISNIKQNLNKEIQIEKNKVEQYVKDAKKLNESKNIGVEFI